MDEIREQNSAEEIIDIYDPQHRLTWRRVCRGEPLEADPATLVLEAEEVAEARWF